MKKQIKLTESEFKALIKESVSKILKEHDLMPGDNGGYFSTSEYNNSKNNTWRGVVGTRFIWHGEWADPEVEYDGELLNANELDDYAWDVYKDTICVEQGTECSEEEFNNLPSDWFAEIIEDYTMNNYISESISMENKQNRDYFSMPVIIVGGKLNGKYTINDVINNFEVTGYVERFRNSAYKNSKIVGYPMIKGYHGPMWDGDRIRYESPEVYHSLSI